MVSHFDVQEQPVTRSSRAQSVISRASSSSRRHRHTRSLHGGSTSSVQNEFPLFAYTGDVEVVLASRNGRKEQRYLLHRLILSQCSGWFEDDTKRDMQRAITAGPNLSQTYRNGSLSRTGERDSSSSDLGSLRSLEGQAQNSRLVYVLNWGQTGCDESPMLVQRHLQTGSLRDTAGPLPVSRSKPPTSSSSFFRSMSNYSALNVNDNQQAAPSDPEDHVLRDYDNLLRIFYNYAPSLNNISIADAYTECKALLQLAEVYDALAVVGPRIDHHLLRFGNRLFKQIAKYPPSYLKLGYLAQSKTIFAESFIHVVGQWPIHQPQLDRSIDIAVLDLIEDKYDMLNDLKSKVEGKLFRLTLTTSRGERVSPSNNFLDWLAMSLFRQWLAENTTPAPVSILKDSQSRTTAAGRPTSNGTTTGTLRHTSRNQISNTTFQRPGSSSGSATTRVFQLLASTNNESYLPHDELKRFLKTAPEGLYNRENLRRFERRMDEVKNLARDVVKPVTRNCLELDTGGEGLGYLTCTRVAEEDFPWQE